MTSRRTILSTLGTSGLIALAGCLGGSQPSTDSVEGAPIPENPADRTYPEMGTDGPRITYYGNWKCPVCAEFSIGSDRVLSLGTLVEDYVNPGSLRIRYRAMAYTSSGDPFLGPDAIRAARAGLAVWNVDPARFWPYYEEIMRNQPPENEHWATTDRLLSFAEDADVDSINEVRDLLEGDAYHDAVSATTEAAQQVGVDGTPLLVVDGVVHSPFDTTRTRDALDAIASP